MNGKVQNLRICDKSCIIYLPYEYAVSDKYYPVVYINGEDEINEVMSRVEPHFDDDCEKFILVSIISDNWNEDYTPWPAPPLTKKSESFGGGAESYLKFVENSIKPYIDEHYRTKDEPENTAIAGYSLGGLAALHALYRTNVFGKAASISGSLWYSGWIDFMEKSKPLNTKAKVYLSLGLGEEKSRNKLMASVGECTRKAFDLLSVQLSDEKNVVLQWNEGGHFNESNERFVKGILWLMVKSNN